MPTARDGPATSQFSPLAFRGTVALSDLAGQGISDEMSAAVEHAPSGECVAWGIPFHIGDVAVLQDEVVAVDLDPTNAAWLVLMHTSDRRPFDTGGIISPMRGQGRLAEHASDYVLLYEDGTEVRASIRRRHQIGDFQRFWGENCFEAVTHRKPHPMRAAHEQPVAEWGKSQGRATAADSGPWVNWLWAWKNPHPDKAIVGIRFEPVSGLAVVSAISAGDASSLPLRWLARRKAVLTLPEGEAFKPDLSEQGLLQQVQLDMGQVISAVPRPLYPNDRWAETYDNQIPARSDRELLLEYTAHTDASFHFANGQAVPLSSVVRGERWQGEGEPAANSVQTVAPATRRVTLRTVERQSGKPVPVKLHVHGGWGEYLAPVDRHRIANPAWFEDYSVDFVHTNQELPSQTHPCTYIPGETTIDLPLGGCLRRGIERVLRSGRCAGLSRSQETQTRSSSNWKRSCPGGRRGG